MDKKFIWIGIAVFAVIAIVAYYFHSKKEAAIANPAVPVADPTPSIVDKVISAVTGATPAVESLTVADATIAATATVPVTAGTLDTTAPSSGMTVAQIEAKIAEINSTLGSSITNGSLVIYSAITTPEEKLDFKSISNAIPNMSNSIMNDLAGYYVNARRSGKTHAQSIDSLDMYAEKY